MGLFGIGFITSFVSVASVAVEVGGRTHKVEASDRNQDAQNMVRKVLDNAPVEVRRGQTGRAGEAENMVRKVVHNVVDQDRGSRTLSGDAADRIQDPKNMVRKVMNKAHIENHGGRALSVIASGRVQDDRQMVRKVVNSVVVDSHGGQTISVEASDRVQDGMRHPTILALVDPPQAQKQHLSGFASMGGMAAGSWPVRGVDLRWLMEDCVGVGAVRVGLPSIATISLQANPMFESVRLIKNVGDVGKMTLLPFSAMAASNIVWFTYGIIDAAPSVWLQGAVGSILGLYYCRVFCRFCPKNADWLPYTKDCHWLAILAVAVYCAFVAATLSAAQALRWLGVLGNVASVIMFAGPLGAIRTVLKDQSTQSMPLGFTCCVALACSLWTYQGYVILGDPFLYVSCMAGFVVATVQLALFAYFSPVSMRVFGSRPRTLKPKMANHALCFLGDKS
jgi:uncharacterized protein with PQ loop repeat